MPTPFRLFAGIAAVLLLVSGALAQMGPSEAGPYGLPLARRQLLKYCDMLGFDADQKAAARALHDAYRVEFNETAKRTGEKAETVSGRDEATLVDAYVSEIQDLERRLFEDVKSLCTPDQSGKFAAIERARRRDIGRRLAFAAGDGIDLPDLLSAQKIARTPEVEEIVLRWEQDIDRVEQERDRTVRTAMKELIGAEGENERRMRQTQEFMSNLMKVSFRHRDLTRRAVRELDPHLSEAERETLKGEVRARSFPRIWGKAEVEGSLDAAMRFSDLKPEQREKITELRDTYLRDAEPINTRWAAAAEEKQAQLADNFQGILMGEQDSSTDPFYAARSDRQALDLKTLEALRAVLNEEQRGRLPDQKTNGYSPPEFMPDFDQIEEDWEAWQGDED